MPTKQPQRRIVIHNAAPSIPKRELVDIILNHLSKGDMYSYIAGLKAGFAEWEKAGGGEKNEIAQ